MEFCFDVTGDCKSNWIPKICVHKFMPLNITPTKGQDENVSYIGQRGDYRPVNSANPICSWFIINLNSNHMSLDQDNKHRSSTHFRGWHLQWLTVAWEHMDTGNLNCLLFKRKQPLTLHHTANLWRIFPFQVFQLLPLTVHLDEEMRLPAAGIDIN